MKNTCNKNNYSNKANQKNKFKINKTSINY